MPCADAATLPSGSSSNAQPPANASSLSPSCRLRQARCTAIRPEEHAVSNVIAGPCRPSAWEIRPDATLLLRPVTAYGLAKSPEPLVSSR